MALWVCQICSTKYAVGLSRCPRCHGTEFEEDGAMPKIARDGGSSNVGVTSSVGNSSSTSIENVPTNAETAEPVSPQPVPTTELPSSPAQTASSSVDSTVGYGSPKRNSSKAEWVEFVSGFADFEGDPAGYTRDELISWWEDRQG